MTSQVEKFLNELTALNIDYHTKLDRLKSAIEEYACSVCPYKEGQRIEAHGLDGKKGIFVIHECSLSDEDPLEDILNPEYDSHLWRVRAYKEGVHEGEAGISDKCYIYGMDDTEEDGIKILDASAA